MPTRLTLLGTVSLTSSDSRPLRRALQQRRLALLAVLATAPDQSASRDRLLGLLWPDRDERTARHLLADSVYVLRRALGHEAISAAGETLRLSADHVWTDVTEFQRAVADARWSDALRLYRGEFLDGFFVRNATDFDQWALMERSRLHALAVRAANASASRQRRATDIDSATAGIIARGRYHWHQRTRESILRAIEYFNHAVERDTHAVEGWCGLADSWIAMAGRGYVPTAVAIARAAASAERAITADDTLSATHTTMGGVHILRRRWHDAVASLRRAITIDPANADARHWLAMTMLTAFGARDEAFQEQAIAATLNPTSALQLGALGWLQYLRREFALSRSSMEPALHLNADLEEGHAGLARAAARLGDDAMVANTIAGGLTRGKHRRGDLLAEHASALAVLGDMPRAQRLAEQASAEGATSINLALAWASVGDASRAMDCLSRDSLRVYWAPQAIWWDPRLDAIRDDRRFGRIWNRVADVWSPEWR